MSGHEWGKARLSQSHERTAVDHDQPLIPPVLLFQPIPVMPLAA